MEKVSKKTAGDFYDLSKIVRKLQDEFQDGAPSYVTLRRWIKDGLLDSAVRKGRDGARPQYLYSGVVRIFQSSRLAARKSVNAAPITVKNTSTKAAPSAFDIEPSGEMVKNMARDLAELRSHVNTLVAIQRNLAAKYDAESTLLKSENSTLKEMLRLKTNAGGGDLLDMARIVRSLSAIRDDIGEIKLKIE